MFIPRGDVSQKKNGNAKVPKFRVSHGLKFLEKSITSFRNWTVFHGTPCLSGKRSHFIGRSFNQLSLKRIHSDLEIRITDNCCKCGEGISNERPGCTALDQMFHVACFTCKECDKQLAGGSFYNVDGKPLCEQDYVVRFFNNTNIV